MNAAPLVAYLFRMMVFKQVEEELLPKGGRCLFSFHTKVSCGLRWPQTPHKPTFQSGCHVAVSWVTLDRVIEIICSAQRETWKGEVPTWGLN